MMRFTFDLTMANDRGLVGNMLSRRWDLSFLDSDAPPTLQPPSLWRDSRRTSCDGAFEGLCTPSIKSPSDDGSFSVRRRHSFVPSQSPSTSRHSVILTSNCTNRSPLNPLDSVAFLSGVSMTESGTDRSLSLTHTAPNIYENGRIQGANFVTLINSHSGVHPTVPTNPLSPVQLLTVTSSGSEADTGSRLQSISSQDSSDLDSLGFRIRDDSGIGISWGVEGLARRNFSAPVLNDLSIVVCRPSPSPLIEFPSELVSLNSNPDAKTDNKQYQDEYMKVARFLPSWDLERLSTVFHRLSICRFYLGKLSFDEAKFLLKGYPVGTFLLRDSSDRRFLFSLSVQTNRGTTSIRVVYEAGHFRLDSELEQMHLMPTFDCVIHLIRYYIRLAMNQSRRGVRNNFVFLETTGRKDTPVLLRQPWANRPSTLKHLCRLRINGVMGNNSIDRLQLIPSLKNFLGDYPYDI